MEVKVCIERLKTDHLSKTVYESIIIRLPEETPVIEVQRVNHRETNHTR